ncbi:MAG: hypothetical protein ACYDBJ_27635 [Aggregatilineales bacterium]
MDDAYLQYQRRVGKIFADFLTRFHENRDQEWMLLKKWGDF